MGNEYFYKAEEGQNKASGWVGYIFPSPLGLNVLIHYVNSNRKILDKAKLDATAIEIELKNIRSTKS